MSARRVLILTALAVGLVGCTSKDSRRPASVEAPVTNVPDPWVLATTDPKHPTPALLWNGNVGFRIGRSGSPVLEDGTVLPAFSIESYQESGEEKIVPLEDWFDTRVTQPPFNSDLLWNYRQALNLRTGILETSWTMEDGKRRLQITRETILDPSGPPVWGERRSTKVAATSDLQGPDERMILDSFEQTHYLPRALDAGDPPSEDFAAIAKRSEAFWKEFWQTDIEIDGPVEDQQAVRSFLYYLRTAIHPDSDRAVSPLGLSGQTYFGHVFWDADLWVFPALMLMDPERAATIPNYRIAKARGARENYLRWVQEGRPVGKGEPLSLRPADPIALMYPWESSVTGRETVPGPSRHQHHISATVVHALELAAALGLAPDREVTRIGKGVAAFLMDRGEKRADGQMDFRGTMSPDEHHIGTNDLFTNVVANQVLEKYAPTGTPRFTLPRDGTSLISYQEDRFKGYKQAAGVLSIYPLQHPEAERDAMKLMGRMEGGVIQNGPAMTDSVHAIIHARFGDRERAYELWRKSWNDFTQHPLMLFSEKRRKEVTYFTTGAGGALQTVLFGFAGIRIDDKPLSGSKWTQRLGGGKVISCKPKLPSAWRKMTIRGLRVRDAVVDLEITPETVLVSPHRRR